MTDMHGLPKPVPGVRGFGRLYPIGVSRSLPMLILVCDDGAMFELERGEEGEDDCWVPLPPIPQPPRDPDAF